jgi:DNA-binding transcriptional ArsR family regulator
MSSVFQVLADPTRRRIVETLRHGECSVNDIVNVVGIRQSGVSRHLRILQEAGFVVVRGEAQERIYSLRAEPFLELDAWLSEYRNPKKSEVEGALLHAKHALQPNSLGYCGPDENETILEHLYGSTTSERLMSTLTRFESAYPFIRMIAKSTGRQPFDREVTEAYWIGNHLLDDVEPSDFYQFTNQDLNPTRKRVARMDGIGREDAKFLFKELGPIARPHHSFYVLGMYARSSVKSGSESKLLRLMDSCRISWGEVVDVRKVALSVERPALAMNQDQLSLTRPQMEEVRYDPRIPSFSGIRRGDWVSVHWNFASERLTPYQLRNLKKYTALDIEATNRLVASRRGSN